MDDQDIEAAVEQRRLWLEHQLQAAADRFGVTTRGDTVNTYDMRSAGRPARTSDGEPVWLRVVLEDPDYQPHCRWDGNVTANAIANVPKPTVHQWADWAAGEYAPGRRVRGEVMDLAPGAAVSQESILHDDPGLPDQWWSDLTAAVAALAAHPVPEPDDFDLAAVIMGHVEAHFGVTLDPALFASLAWTAAHTDLHWANLAGPQLSIMDWETWRRAPAGYDAATLYCASLLHPPTARRVRDTFASVLDTATGRVALLGVAARYLCLTTDDHLQLEPHLHSLGEKLLKQL
ncbi:hypothetical protein [Amycolatopsis sp. NPDC059657]|uniref:hypothetical protein n=1 Tax=Amycolatopsis sp. NPDC059657 TaxID=3346899 RepID=UPI003670525A